MDIEFHILAYKPDKAKLERCLDSFKTRDIPFVLYNTEENIAVSRNLAYQNCKAEFCSYVDDDDEILIQKRAVSRLVKDYQKPIFTNSEIYSNNQFISYLNNQNEVSWTLEKELLGTVNTHQLMIFKTSDIQGLSKKVLKFLVDNNIDMNLFDYFIRIFISMSSGWRYKNCSAYRYHTDYSFTSYARATKLVPFRYHLRQMNLIECQDLQISGIHRYLNLK